MKRRMLSAQARASWAFAGAVAVALLAAWAATDPELTLPSIDSIPQLPQQLGTMVP